MGSFFNLLRLRFSRKRKPSSDNLTHRRRSKKAKTIGSAMEEILSGETRYLPQGVLEEILFRLPVKSLVRLRCVSKSWLSLISSPKFIKAHLKFRTKDPTFSNQRIMLGISYDEDQESLNNGSVSSVVSDLFTENVNCPNNPTEWRFHITGSCNGLLCVSMIHYYFLSVEHTFLWNPSLRMSKELPALTDELAIVAYTYGVGYDEPNDDYKVVGLFKYFCYDDEVLKLMVKIYSVKSGYWKRIDDYKGGLPCSCSSVVSVARKFHFGAEFKHDDSSTYRWNIVTLDIESEDYGAIEQPKYETTDYIDLSLGVLNGCLSALYSFKRVHGDVWVLKDYGVKESWTQLVRIPYVDGFPYCECIFYNGKYLLGHRSQLIVYDPEDNSSVRARKSDIEFINSAAVYVESLVSPQARI